jgi:aspartyl-tRNA(Asn)/glutamyl-tRNA(Gln) amidotransferase subunit A
VAASEILAVADAYRRRELSPVEVTRAVLARIERLNPALNAFLTVTADSALAQARRAEEEFVGGEVRSPFQGVPVSVKDLFCTKDVETTAGSLLYRGWKPSYDASVVARLRDLGAVLLGKTHMHELAYGITNDNPHYGPCHNPWDVTRIPGGSSGGSAAAVCAGLGYASFGTDTGGSIRIPASYCGVTGFKPTYGRISRQGVIPLSVYLDHVGPFARTVEDAALISEIASPDQLRGDIAGWRIGVVRGAFTATVRAAIWKGVEQAAAEFEKAGAHVEEVEIADAIEIGEIAHMVQMADGAAHYQKKYRESPHLFGEDVRRLIEEGHLVPAVDYINAQRLRRQFQKRFHALFDRVRALLLPATPITAPRIGETKVDIDGVSDSVGGASTSLVRPFNLAGVPVLTVPCGFDEAGLPFGMQIVTRAGDDLSGLKLGCFYQSRTGWHTRLPK